MSVFRGLVVTALVGAAAAALTIDQAFAGGKDWSQDMAAAMRQAKSEHKDLLLDFTGSDWCQYCVLLNQEVFSQEPFTKEAPKRFVMVELDFPNDTSHLSEATQQQNEEWRTKFDVVGFPTILLADELGRPYAQTGYEEGGGEKYLAHLDELRKIRVKRDEAFAAAEKSQGMDRAKHLDAALAAVGESLAVKVYGDQLREVIQLDVDNTAGLKQKYEQALANAEFDKALLELKKTFAPEAAEQSLQQLDAAVAKYSPDAAHQLDANFFRVDVLGAVGRYDDMLTLIEALMLEAKVEPLQKVQLGLQKISLLRRSGQDEVAIGYFDELIPIAGDDTHVKAQLMYLKGKVLSLNGKVEEALKLYDEAIATTDDQSLKAHVEQAKAELSAAPAAASGQ